MSKEKTYVRKVVSNSRDKGKCPVCDVSTRMDKLKIHFSKYVLWDDNDTVLSSVCESSNPRNKRASTKYQCHTDYARTKNIKSDSIPSFQIISLVKDNMRIKKFFNINNNNREGDEAGEHQNEEMDLDQSLNSEEDPDPSNANLNSESENTLCLCLTTEHRCRRCHLKFSM